MINKFNMTDNDEWKWQEFVKIGNTIHQKRCRVRVLEAENGLGFATDLVTNGYVRANKGRFELYKYLLRK